jgi:hypothetical protein
MDTPQNLHAAPAPTLGKRTSAAGQIDGISFSAMLAIFIGWFFIDTLVVGLGSLQHGVRFFDITAVIGDPTRMFFGIEGSFQRILFGLVCLVCLLAPLLLHGRRNRLAWAAYLAPLALMMLCGALLYWKTSGDFFSVPGESRSVASTVIRFVNDRMHQGSVVVSRHVSIGVGAYLAFAGSLVLALQGLRQLHRHAA